MQLYPDQLKLKSEVYTALHNYRRVMVQCPTGGGKTVIFTEIVRDFLKAENYSHRAWVLVHRKELIEQTMDKACNYGLTPAVIQSDYVSRPFEKYQIASIQTLTRRIEKYRSFDKFHPTVIICDEAHHSTAESYDKIYKAFPGAFILGFTATPIRTNGQGFRNQFDHMVIGPSIKELIDNKRLTNPKIFTQKLDFDLQKIKVTAGDYNEKDLYEAFEENCTYGDLVKSYQTHANGKKNIVFAINIEHSKQIVEAYNKAGIPAEHIDGTTPKELRKSVLARFRSGTTMVVSNVGIITEGFDVPDCDCVQLVKATKSLALFLQMVGRGLRAAPGKEYAVVLDHANCIATHGFPQEDRIWTLDGVSKKPKIKVLMRDVETKKEYEPRDLPNHVTEVELVELDYDEVRFAYMEKLFKQAKKRGFDRPGGYAWRMFTSKYPIPTPLEIKEFQKLANYEQGWIYYKLKEYGHVS